jgi:B-cell receptor-associated protein 31
VVALTSYGSLYFNVILVALVLLLLDAIREITKYKTRLNTSNDPTHGSLHYGPTMELVREFRAQRNFYISGTALFLWLYAIFLFSLYLL